MDIVDEVLDVVVENVAVGGQELAIVAPLVDIAALGAVVGAAMMQGLQQLLGPLLDCILVAEVAQGEVVDQ